jgi:hypothetical protein
MADQPQNQQSQTQTQPQQGMNLDEDQFFNKYKPTMSEEEFFNKYDNNRVQNTHNFWFQKGPYEGPGSDYWFQQSPLGRILSAFGQGAKDSWGQGEQTALGSEIKWEAEQKKSDQGLVYGFHTSVMRPAAAAIDSLMKPVFSLGGSFSQGIGQIGEELSKQAEGVKQEFQDQFPQHPEGANLVGSVLAAPAGALGELAKGLASGAGLEGGLGVPDHIQTLQEARSKGIIGEGEAGYFQTKKPTPENIEARKIAAVASGELLGPETLEQWMGPKLVPNQGEIARQIDPDLFKELDRLQSEQENLRLSRDAITSKLLPKEEITDRGTYLEQQKLQKSLEDIPERLQSLDEQLRDLIPDVAEAKTRSQELLESDSPEGHAFRNLIQAQAFEKAIALEEAKPKVIAAYRDAADLIPSEETGNAPTNSVSESKSSKPAATIPSAASQIVSVLPEYRGGLKDVKGGTLKESGLNRNIMIDAVQKGFDAKFQDAPLYHSITHADQAQKAFDYLESNEKAAMEVAMGDKEPPTGIHPEAILMALREKAYAEGDIDLIQSLSQTRLGREASVMGQRLGLLRNLREDIDPLNIIQEIQDLWKDKGQKLITKTIEDIQNKIRENMVDLHAQIGEFLKSIECDY